MPKRQNPWMAHLAQFWKANKGKMSYSAAMKAAKKTYKKKKVIEYFLFLVTL